MTNPVPLPTELADVPFTTRQALQAGLTTRALRGKRFQTLFRGVHVRSGLAVTMVTWLHAALLVVPADGAVSHVTALWLYGVEVGRPWPVHLSTNTALVCIRSGIRLHRRRGRLHPRVVRGTPVLGPDRSFVDSATIVGFLDLVTAGDWLLHLRRTDLATLTDYVTRSHLDGVLRARRALAWVRERVESPMETLVRLMIVFARLPEPSTNIDIHDADGRFVARGDMPYFAYNVLVEYDGEWHERDRKQRQRDRERREELEALGWTVIVVLAEDLKDKRAIVWRVYRALTANGYAGREPHFNAMWTNWFDPTI